MFDQSRILHTQTVGIRTFHLIDNPFEPTMLFVYGSFKASSHSGLGGILKKDGFTQKQIKEVYAFMHSDLSFLGYNYNTLSKGTLVPFTICRVGIETNPNPKKCVSPVRVEHSPYKRKVVKLRFKSV